MALPCYGNTRMMLQHLAKANRGASLCWGRSGCYESDVTETTHRNERKRAVLGFLASRARPATVQEIAWAIRLPYAPRGLYGLLSGYSHWGLIQHYRGPDGRLRFWLTDRGRQRLAWLRLRQTVRSG